MDIRESLTSIWYCILFYAIFLKPMLNLVPILCMLLHDYPQIFKTYIYIKLLYILNSLKDSSRMLADVLDLRFQEVCNTPAETPGIFFLKPW